MDVSTIRLEHKIAAVLACLRNETTYEAAAQQLGITAADVQEWEHTLLSAGSQALKDRENNQNDISMAERNASLYEQTQAQLREISQFRRLADEAIVGIMTRDVDGVIDYVNAAAARLFGYPDPADMRGLPMRDLYPNDTWYEVDQQHCLQALRDGGWVGETTQKRRDGETIITEMSIFPIHTPDGTFTTYGTVVQDITERQQFADLMQQANA